MKTVVFATCSKAPGLQPGDALLARTLDERSVRVIAAPWNGLFEPFAGADLIVIRSTWDYQTVPNDFRAWIAQLESLDAKVVNAPALMKWNIEKTYLLDLAQHGAPIPPTRLADPAPDAIAAAMDALGLEEAVVKPVIGATASGLSIVRRGDSGGIKRAAAVLGYPGLVQPLIPEIRTAGETSLIYFGGAFSHAVVKRPKPGSILVQSDHGGVSEAVRPPDWAVTEGSRILSLLAETPHYARVDAVILDESLILMEVELIEPELFFAHEGDAAGRLADVLMKELDA